MSASLPSNFLVGASLDTPQFLVNTTAVGIAALGANCPAGIVAAPYTWAKILTADGSIGWIPVWK